MEGKASRSCLDEEGGAGSGRADWLCNCRSQKLDSVDTDRINAGAKAEVKGVFSGGVWPEGGQAEVVAVVAVVTVGDSAVFSVQHARYRGLLGQREEQICAGGSGLSVQKG